METVSVELPPAGAQAGLSEHVALPGQPEATVKFTLPLYPFSAATLIVDVAELPEFTLADVGLADSEKSGFVVQLANLNEPMRVYHPALEVTG